MFFMKETLVFKIRKTKSNTNYIPSLSLLKLKKLAEYPNKNWHYDKQTNELHLIANTIETEQTEKTRTRRARASLIKEQGPIYDYITYLGLEKNTNS